MPCVVHSLWTILGRVTSMQLLVHLTAVFSGTAWRS
jgi:hypothetical protein